MFDIGFSELIIIGVVALIVIGPERLPKVARTAGHLYGRMQRYVSSVKSDISQEIELEELRRTGQQFRQSVESTVTEVQQQTTVVDDYLRDEAAGLRDAVKRPDEPEVFPPLEEPPVEEPPLEKPPAKEPPAKEPPAKEPPVKEPPAPNPANRASDAPSRGQQSLPLDEPAPGMSAHDADAHGALVETARPDSAGKSA